MSHLPSINPLGSSLCGAAAPLLQRRNSGVRGDSGPSQAPPLTLPPISCTKKLATPARPRDEDLYGTFLPRIEPESQVHRAAVFSTRGKMGPYQLESPTKPTPSVPKAPPRLRLPPITQGTGTQKEEKDKKKEKKKRKEQKRVL